MIFKINLSKNLIAIVDKDDFKDLSKFNWHVSNYGYAVRNVRKENGKRTLELMHRVITSAKKYQQVDHINGNKLDNRKENLRLCCQGQNKMNVTKRVDNTSGFKGVTWKKDRNKWMAQIAVNKKKIYLGSFSCKKLAHAAYIKAAIKYHGKFANDGKKSLKESENH